MIDALLLRETAASVAQAARESFALVLSPAIGLQDAGNERLAKQERLVRVRCLFWQWSLFGR